MSKLESAIINIISYTLVIAILLSPIIIVIVIKYNKKEKRIISIIKNIVN